MALVLTATGTLSNIAATEKPVVHRDTVEERYDYDSLVVESDLVNNQGWFPELDQFIGIIAANASLPPLGVAVRLSRMLEIYLNRTRITKERTFAG